MVRALGRAPLWVLPFLLMSAIAAAFLLVLLVVYAVIAAAAVGAVLAAKDLSGAPAQYKNDPPVKAWDGLWAWCTAPDLHPALRLGLFGASGSFAVIIIAVWRTSQLSTQFAWGLLGATAVLGGVESYMRHHHVCFRVEAAWVMLEVLVLGGVIAARPHGWVLGVAAACAIEIVGFITGFSIATAHVDRSRGTECPAPTAPA